MKIFQTNTKIAAKRFKRNDAFTLLEIMAVVMIIMLLLAFVMRNFMGRVEKSRQSVTEAMVKGTLKSALEGYNMENGGFPTTEQGLKALAEKPSSEPIPQNWQSQMSEIPKDPWGEDYIYAYPGQHNADGYDLSSKGADRKADTDDDIANWKKK